jgi:hypothetical protein
MLPAVTINILSDEVFLEIFACTLVHTPTSPSQHMRQWQSLAQVCQRWRQTIYASPRYLDLHLFCSKNGIPVKNLSYWPAFPIAMRYRVPYDDDHAIAVLKHTDRVRLINLRIMKPLSGEESHRMVAAMQKPFPALTHLKLSGALGWEKSDFKLADSEFLGGSAPCLQEINLYRIPYPELPTLLLSARNLVSLQLNCIPPSGHIPPEAMLASLSVLTRLENLCIVFLRQSYRRRVHPDPPTRAVLPALTNFQFGGCIKYLDDLVAEIDAPRLNSAEIEVYQLDFLLVPQLFLFIGRTENLRFRRVQADLSGGKVKIKLRVYPDDADEQPYFSLSTQFECPNTRTRVAHTSLILTQIFTMCSDVDYLHIVNHPGPGWHPDVNSTEWLAFFRLFPSVKTLHIVGMFAVQVASALEDVPGEMVTGVFPSLHSLILEDSKVPPSTEQFVSLRQLYGCPVTVRNVLKERVEEPELWRYRRPVMVYISATGGVAWR